jgi:hypothetical protein
LINAIKDVELNASFAKRILSILSQKQRNRKFEDLLSLGVKAA